MADLIALVINMLVISLVSFGGGATALFYDYGVTQTGWISNNDLSAIVAFGYATPGPAVFGIGTFLGYRVSGSLGALAGTAAIFLMPWLLALLASKYLSHLLDHPHAKNFVKAVGLAAAGLIVFTAISLMPNGGFTNVGYVLIATASFVATLKKVNPLYIVGACILYGLIFSR